MPGFVEKRRAVGVLPAREQPLFGEEVALGALIKLAFVLAQVFFPIGHAILRRGIHGLRPLETAEVATWFCGLPFS